jgi:hypothetical protein
VQIENPIEFVIGKGGIHALDHLLPVVLHRNFLGEFFHELNKCRLYFNALTSQKSPMEKLTNPPSSNPVPPISIDRTKTARVADKTSPKSTTEIAVEESNGQILHPTSCDNLWARGIHHPAISSDTTLTTDCTISQQVMDDGNKSKRTHSDSNKIPLVLQCKSSQKNHSQRAS